MSVRRVLLLQLSNTTRFLRGVVSIALHFIDHEAALIEAQFLQFDYGRTLYKMGFLLREREDEDQKNNINVVCKISIFPFGNS